WLSPKQAVVLNITDSQADYAAAVVDELNAAGLRVSSDLRNEKVGYKIREHTMARVPYLLVVGNREREAGTVAVRTREGEDQGTMTLQAFAQRAQTEVRERRQSNA